MRNGGGARMGGGSGGFQDRGRKDNTNPSMKQNSFDSRDRSRSNIRSYDNKFSNGNTNNTSNNRDYQNRNNNRDSGPSRMRDDRSKGTVSSTYQTAPSNTTEPQQRYSRFDNNASSSSKLDHGASSYQTGGYANKPKAYGGYENGGSHAAPSSYNSGSGAHQNGSAGYNSSSASATPVFTSFTLQTKMFQFPPPPLPVKN